MVINLEQKKIHFDLKFILTYNIYTYQTTDTPGFLGSNHLQYSDKLSLDFDCLWGKMLKMAFSGV